jgi:hypothetical protein
VGLRIPRPRGNWVGNLATGVGVKAFALASGIFPYRVHRERSSSFKTIRFV